jgi:pimeloyl-ACP methyl ester carboxylesterase
MQSKLGRMPSPILLVHGAFHTGECWSLLEPHLAARGFEVHALTLGGHRGNPRPAGSVSMTSYGEDVIAAAEAIGRPCLLVGHSMGGMVISQAAEVRPDLFSAMVYVTAFAPAPGESNSRDAAPISEKMMAAMAAGMKMLPDGTAEFPAEGAKAVFYNCCPPQIQDQAVAGLSPQPMTGGADSVRTTEAGLGSVPKHYIECTLDEALPIESQRAMQANMPFRTIQSLETDHSPFLSTPEALADALARAAAA